MQKHSSLLSVAIIGPGRVGQALGRLLAESGVPIACIVGRKADATRRASRFIGQGKPVGVADPDLMNASVLLLTTTDTALEGVARELAGRGDGKRAWQGKVVLHTCGSLPSAILRPLQLRGAAIGSLHPYQTIPSPRTGARNLRGGFWGIEGDRRAVQVARRWVKLLKGTAFAVDPKKKPLYHLSAFLVCPTLVTLMDQSTRVLGQAGVPERISRPMLRRFVTETAENFSEMGARALTGPAVRGDWKVIRAHMSALRQAAPGFLPVYRSLLTAMLRLTGRKAPRWLAAGAR